MRRGRLVRMIVGGLALAIGALNMAGGLFGDPGSTSARLFALISGAVLIFLGVSALSPLIARPVANLLGWPLARIFGVSGRLAQGNATRDPLRTASTASALMIGLALVSMVVVIGSSFKSSFVEQLDRGIQADYFITSEANFGFSPALTEQLASLDVVDQVATFRFGQAKVGTGTKQITGVQPEALRGAVDLGIIDGGVDGLESQGLLLHQDSAEDQAVGVGGRVSVQFPVGGTQELTVVGIFTDTIGGLGNWIVSHSTFERGFPPESQLDLFGGLTIRDGIDPATAQAALDEVAATYPEVSFEDRAEFKESQASQIDQLLVTVNALLAMSLIVAVLGIAITLALSVFERTRELGLLRAVGQQRRQTRRMIRLEAVIVAVLGAVLGLVLGLLFGLAIANALPRSIVTTITVPVGQIVGILVVAALAGVLAAVWPAWRASRLKILDAIAYE